MEINKRISLTENMENNLLTIVNFQCPLCSRPLIVRKNKHLVKCYQNAHIYPHSPTFWEKTLLKDVEILGNDAESEENIIPLCLSCHKIYDHQRTLEEYEYLKKVKQDCISKRFLSNEYYNYQLELELKLAIDKIENISFTYNNNLENISYDPHTIEEKIPEDEFILLRKKIKNNVNDYYVLIRERFKNNSNLLTKSDLICSQIKTFYLLCKQNTSDKGVIFYTINEWFEKRLKVRKEISEIITSYFVQNCEVFDVTK